VYKIRVEWDIKVYIMIKVGADMTNVMNTYSQPSVTFPHKFKAKILNVAPYTPSIYITKQNTTILWHYYEFRTSPAHHGKSANNTIHQSSQNPSLRQRLYSLHDYSQNRRLDGTATYYRDNSKVYIPTGFWEKLGSLVYIIVISVY
jgi:hypothetical protein